MYTGGIGLVVRTASELEGVRESVHWRDRAGGENG